MIIEENEGRPGHLVIDGTRKQKGRDNFERDWPNVIVSDDVTIKKVDDLWPSLNLGKFIPSPSIKYKSIVKQGGAKVNGQNDKAE